MISAIEKAFLDGYATSDINITTMMLCIVITALISLYIYIVYKLINKNSFYNKNFNLSLVGLSIITASVILTIQSNIVVSLGMVGALSIVRFRTAIKDPLDLVFLFWSISVGIICGAGYAMIAVLASMILTIIIILMIVFPAERGSVVLVVDAKTPASENAIMEIVKKNCSQSIVRARTCSKESLNMAIEIKSKNESQLLQELIDNKEVLSASIVEHNGDITA